MAGPAPVLNPLCETPPSCDPPVPNAGRAAVCWIPAWCTPLNDVPQFVPVGPPTPRVALWASAVVAEPLCENGLATACDEGGALTPDFPTIEVLARLWLPVHRVCVR